ncbi:cobyric acid synthase/cobinamide kinase [Cutibacterium avidum ATCC 25577]|uniref:Cobyric acid synthase/cobinamide kinase n=1 Tax=Cutibacterium avidum ATCC 25577 TaxID=997355 RepID=G4CW10_9ACTN|nr:cobyric acid synthase/cobinamide kinase [Cutibacterium avidum ATCC 25577]
MALPSEVGGRSDGYSISMVPFEVAMSQRRGPERIRLRGIRGYW